MCSIVRSEGFLFIATAMVVSSTALFLAFFNPSPLPSSFSSSDDKKREKNKNKKKKKVRFAEDVKEPRGNGEEYRKKLEEKLAMAARRRRTTKTRSCRTLFPANRVVLYNGILKERSQRIECLL